jgi:hypothetical protein
VNIHADYLRDLGDELRRRAEGAAETRADRSDALLQGQAGAFYSVLSLMQQQAEAFGLPMRDLRLDGVDAERDLLLRYHIEGTGVVPGAAAADHDQTEPGARSGRAALDAVGGFPEDLHRIQDIALSWEVQLAGVELHYASEAIYRVGYRDGLLDLVRQGLAGSSCAPLLYKRYRSAGLRQRTVNEVLRSWARLVVDLSKARTRVQLATLMVRLGREIGRAKGSIRHRVFFP